MLADGTADRDVERSDVLNFFRIRRHGDSRRGERSEEHTSELQSLMRISYAVFCLKKKKNRQHIQDLNNLILHLQYEYCRPIDSPIPTPKFTSQRQPSQHK